MAHQGELILCDAVVRTVDPWDRVAEAVLVRGGKIAAVGSERDVRAAARPDAEVRRLRGRTVVPGFIDPHNHLSLSAFEPVSVDCYTPPLADLDAVLGRISEHCARLPAGQWVRAVGFVPMMVTEQRPPTRWELDEAAPDNPVFLLDLSCNAAYVNSRALAQAGISEHSPQPWGGQIVMDRDGRPNGTLLQAALNPLQTASWRAYAAADWDRAVELLEAKMREYLSVGLTSICDAAVTTDAAELYARADAAGRLPFAVQQLHTADDFFGRQDLRRNDFIDRVLGRDTERLRGGTMKIFTDHAFPDGPLMDRLHDGCRVHTGTGYYDKPEIRVMATTARDLGINTAIHAMGNCSVDTVLDAYQAVRALPGSDTALLRLEHAYVAEPAQAPRMAALGVDLVAKPGLVYAHGPMFWDGWRQKGQDHLSVIPIRSMVEAGVRVSFGSDAPAGTFRPADVLWSAVTRESFRGDTINPEEAVTAEEALRCYTINSAHAANRAAEEGSIEVGKRANLVVLDRDVVTCPGDELREMQVLMTYVDGELVHAVESSNATG
ncbi:amidohydrolase [Streptomyces tuirus]|uniref:Amidohydrolase n=1 Tax=Streptomyces tuirus TaxID=68278 RepID=A0A941J3C7_9ACTN|nr:amidohydrolase [Streptomyces tuirus]